MRHPFYFLFASLFACSVFAQENPASISTFWTTDTVFKTPESALYDKVNDILYVTNINKVNAKSKDGDGFISKLKPDGQVDNLKWIVGLNDPKGMAIYKTSLFVGDLTELIEIDLVKGIILKRYTIEGANFMNDVAADANGVVWVSDSYANKVYVLKNGKLELWMEGTSLDKPNGLYIEKDKILLANMNQGKIYQVDPVSKVMKEWAANVTKTDGIATDGKGNYFATNWDGEVYYINSKGASWKLLDTKEQKINAADLDYLEKYKLLVVPTFFGNKVVAYKVAIK